MYTINRWKGVCQLPRQKKDYIPLHIKMDTNLMKRLEDYCEKAGQTKTMAIERIVKEFLDRLESR